MQLSIVGVQPYQAQHDHTTLFEFLVNSKYFRRIRRENVAEIGQYWRETGMIKEKPRSVRVYGYFSLCMQDLSSCLEDLGAGWREYLKDPALHCIQVYNSKDRTTFSNSSVPAPPTIDHRLGSMPTLSQTLRPELEGLGRIQRENL